MGWLRQVGRWLVLWPLWERMPWSRGAKTGAAFATGVFLFIVLVVVIAAAAGGGGTEEEEQAAAQPVATAAPTPSPVQPSPTARPSPTPTAVVAPRPADCIPARAPEEASLVRVVDGDTIEVSIGGRTARVRYIGVNTPERDQPYYAEATQANERLVSGARLYLYKDVSETDQFGRLLRYVVAGDRFVNLELVKGGYAQAATYPPDVACSQTFVAAEREARAAQVGLWAPAPQQPPSQPQPQPQPQPPSGQVYYRNCAEARAAGAAPLYRGQPGYRPELDRDGDGVACE